MFFIRLNPFLVLDVAETQHRLGERQKVKTAGRAKAKATQATLALKQAIEIIDLFDVRELIVALYVARTKHCRI